MLYAERRDALDHLLETKSGGIVTTHFSFRDEMIVTPGHSLSRGDRPAAAPYARENQSLMAARSPHQPTSGQSQPISPWRDFSQLLLRKCE